MVTRPKISLTKLIKITKLIKDVLDVFEEEFRKQEVNITNIIRSNFTLTMKERYRRSKTGLVKTTYE